MSINKYNPQKRLYNQLLASEHDEYMIMECALRTTDIKSNTSAVDTHLLATLMIGC